MKTTVILIEEEYIIFRETRNIEEKLIYEWKTCVNNNFIVIND